MTNILKKQKSPDDDFTCKYRTTPYQYINTAPPTNISQKVGELSKIDIQTRIIKPNVVSSKVK